MSPNDVNKPPKERRLQNLFGGIVRVSLPMYNVEFMSDTVLLGTCFNKCCSVFENVFKMFETSASFYDKSISQRTFADKNDLMN